MSLLIAYNLHWIYFDVDASRQYLHTIRRHVVPAVLFDTFGIIEYCL